jgi:glycosyltransferase involved in cell wall biosynthesis
MVNPDTALPASDRRPHILFLVASLAVGGAEKQLLALLNHIDTGQYKLSLAYLKNDSTLLTQVDRSKLDGRVFCCDVRGGVEVAVIRHLANLIDDEAVRLIVAVNCYAYAYALGSRLLANSRAAVMTIFHSTAMFTLREHARMAVYKRLLPFCESLVYVCHHQEAYWQKRQLTARTAQVIHNGVDLRHYSDSYSDAQKTRLRESLGFGATDFVIGLCGAMRPEKAHVDLIRAVAMLRSDHQTLRCLLIGDGPERPSIVAEAQKLGVAQSVAITGFVADVRPYIASCDAMALVSRTEAFSLAALEAMAMGKAILMTRVGGAEEQVEHGVTGLLLPPGRVDCLAAHIGYLMHSGAAAEMGRRAREKVAAEFSQSAMIAAYEAAFGSLLPDACGERENVGAVS